jgi:hypothetical protein
MKKLNDFFAVIWGVILMVVVLAVFGFGIYWFVAALIDKIASVEGDLGKTLVTSSVTILIAVISLVGGKLYEQKLKIREDIRLKKIPVYEKLIGTFLSVVMQDKLKKKKITEQELAAAFVEFSEKLMIWGSSDVIKAWVKFKKVGTEGHAALYAIEVLFLAIRKDLGNDVSLLKNHELLHLFVNDLDQNGNPPASNQTQHKKNQD